MSVGTRPVTAIIYPSRRLLCPTSDPYFRQSVTWTLVGANQSAEQLILLAYRGSTIVAIAPQESQYFSGTSVLATGTMDLNTTELLAAMGDTAKGVPFALDLALWNSSSYEFVAGGRLNVLGAGTYSDVSTNPTSPISDATVFWGNLAIYDGKTYLKNTTTGKYREISLAGTGDQTHQTMSDEEIDIPGG